MKDLINSKLARVSAHAKNIMADGPVSRRLGLAGLLLILIGNAVFLKYNLTRSFNFLDMGAFLDAAWRVYTGQRIYQDFIYNSGPVHAYLNVLFFHLFGFGPTAIWAHLVSVHSLAIVLVFFLIWKRLPVYLTLLITAMTTASFYWGISFPWHDQTAHLWGIAGIFILYHEKYFSTRRTSFWAGFFIGLLAGLAFFTKSNLGAGYCLIFLVGLAMSDHARYTLAGFAGGALVSAFGGLLMTGSPGAYWRQRCLLATAIGKDRLPELLKIQNWFVNFYWLPLVLALLNTGPLTRRFLRQLIFITCISLMGVLAANTGGMVMPANISLWGIQVAAVMIYLAEVRPFITSEHLLRIYFMSRIIMIGLILGLTGLAVRNGLELRTWGYVKWEHIGTYALQTGPLKGWKCHPFQGRALDDLTRFINQRIPLDDDILNITDMYIIYAQTGRPSYKGVPTAFMQGYFPAPGRQTEEVRAHILANPPDWIIVDLGMLVQQEDYLGLREFIKQNYTIVFRTGLYLLLRQ